MNLQRAKEYVSEVGKFLAEKAMDDPENNYFEAITSLILAKKAIIKIHESEQRIEYLNEQYKARAREIHGREVTFYPADSGAVSSGCGVDGGDAGTGDVPRDTQAHVTVPQE